MTTGTSAAEVTRLEALPFDTLWVGGHVASPNPSPEVMMQLARVAALTSRVRVGSSILLLPLYSPAIVAKQVADLDRVTGGRVILGVGIGGEYPKEFEACGVPIAERGPRTDESIGLLRRLWSAEPVTHAGRYYPMTDVRIHPAPAQPGGPPIIVAGRRRPAMRRAALLGDGWMPYLYSPERYGASVEEIGAFADEAGRDLTAFSWMAFVFVTLAERVEDARRDASAFFGGTYNQDMEAFVDRVAAVGNPAQVAERLGAFIAAGARHLIIAAATRGDRLALVERISGEVLPLVSS